MNKFRKVVIMKKVFLTLAAIAALSGAGTSLAWSPFNLPPGNYRQTCNACTMMGHELNCMCQDRQGFPVNSSKYIPNRCNYVQNFNGHLRCTNYRHRHHHWHPYNYTRNFGAGPIWNNADAQQKCPSVCDSHHGRWTGTWNTVNFGRNSVCQCRV